MRKLCVLLVLVLAVRGEEEKLLRMMFRNMHDVAVKQQRIMEDIRALSEEAIKTSGCWLRVISWGNDDDVRSGGVWLDGTLVANTSETHPVDRIHDPTTDHDRGIGVMIAHRNHVTGKCDVKRWRIYDTHHNSRYAVQLSNFLKSQADGTVIAFVTADEVTGSITSGQEGRRTHIDRVRPDLLAMGIDLTALEYQGSFAYVAIKGSKSQTVGEIKPKGKGPAVVDYFLP